MGVHKRAITVVSMLGVSALCVSLLAFVPAAGASLADAVTEQSLPAGVPAPAEVPVLKPKTTGYTPLVPARLADTRSGAPTVDAQLAGTGAQAGGTSLDVSVLGRGGVPATDVSAVVVNITAVSPDGTGYLTAYPAGIERPLASNLNFAAGDVVANQAIVRVGATGAISVFTSTTTNLLIDVVGYVNADSAAGIMAPARLADTRVGTSTVDTRFAELGRLGALRTLNVSVLGRAGVPNEGVQAAILTVTAVRPAAAGYLTVYPAGHGQPNASSVNYVGGQTVANQVIVGVGADGMVSIFTASDTDLIVDIAGWVPTGTDLHTQNPSRLMDTRATGATVDGLHQGGGAVAAESTTVLGLADRSAVPANGFGSVILNVTAVNARGDGHLRVYPAGAPMPNASSLNFEAGQTIANQVIARVGTHGEIVIYASAGTDLIVDVAGWLPPGENQVDPRVVTISDPETPVALTSGGPGTGGARLVPPAGADLRVDDLIAITTPDGRAYYGQVSSTNVGSVDTVEVPLNKILPTLSISVQGNGETGILDPSLSSGPALRTLELPGQPPTANLSIPRFGDVECKAIGGPATLPVGLQYEVNATSFVFDVDWGWTGLNSAKVGYNPSFTFMAEAEVEVGITCSKTMNLASWNLPTIRFAVAGIPVVITQEISVDIELGLEAKASADFSSGISGSAFAGVVYDGSWHLAKELNLDKRWKADNVKVSAELTASLTVKYEAAAYGILKVGAGIGPEIKATIEPLEETWLTIEASLKAEATAGIELDLYFFTYEKEITLAEITLIGPYTIYERTRSSTLDLSTSDVPSSVVENTPYTGEFKVAGGKDTSDYTFTVTGLPPGLSVATSGRTATISGTPSATGYFSVKAVVKEVGAANTEDGAETFAIRVTPRLKLNTTGLLAGEVGATYDRNLVAGGGKGPFTWQVDGLPAGLSISALPGSPVAMIAGTPTTAGSSSVRVRLSDAAGSAPIDTTFALTVAPPILITNPTTPDSAVGAPIRIVYTASQGVAPYNWTTSGLPAGTSAVKEGASGERLVISGSATLANPYSLRVTGHDSARGRTRPSAGSGNISAPLSMRSTSSTVPLAPAVWQSDDGVVEVKGGVAPYQWTITGLPTGVTFDASQTTKRVRIAGAATTAGSYTVHIVVNDAAGSPPISVDFPVVVADSLRIVTTTANDGTVGAVYSTTLQIAGGVAPYKWTIARIPDGLTLGGTNNDATRVMSGTPQVAGAYQMTVYVSDSSGRPARQKTLAFSMTPGVSFITSTLPNASLNRDYTAALEVTGGRAPYVWTVSGLPAGLTLDTNTTQVRRTFVGAPTSGGTSSVVVRVTGADGESVERTFLLNVSSILQMDATGLSPYVRRTAYTGQVVAQGGIAPLVYSATGLVDGLSLNSANGQITGSFQRQQTSNVVFTVTAANGEFRSQNFVMFGVDDLAVTGPAMPTSGFTTVAYSGRPTRTGGLEPFTWSATGLPSWASLDPFTGTISGTPAAANTGTSTISVKAVSADGQQATYAHTLAVAASQAMTLNVSGVPTTGTAGTAYTGTASFTGGNAPVLSIVQRPSWATFNTSTRTISGTPTVAGDYVITFRLSDVGNATQEQTVNISVTAPSAVAFNWVSPALPNAVLNSAYTGALEVSGGVAPYTWTVTGLPAGLSLDASTTAARRTFTGSATTAGTSSVVVHVVDSAGTAIDRTYSVSADDFLIDLSNISPYLYTSAASYSREVRAIGGVAPITFSATNLPTPFCCAAGGGPHATGLKLNATTGVLSGYPEMEETKNTTFTVTDANGATRSQTIAMYVLDPVELIAIDPAGNNFDPTTVFPRVAYTAQAFSGLVFSFGSFPLTWSVQGLPGWATTAQEFGGSSQRLRVTGVPGPADIGTSTLTFTAINPDGIPSFYSTLSVPLEVRANTSTDIVVTGVPSFGTVGQAYSATATATGNTPVMTMTATPSWATFGADTDVLPTAVSHTLTGTPTAAGDYVATFKVVDGVKPVQQKSVVVKVSNPLTVPAAGLPASVAKDQAASFAIASAGGRAPITWSITNLPTGLAANASTGVVSGTATTVETKTVSATATDADGRVSATRTFSLEVLNATAIAVTATGAPQTATVGQAYTGSITATGGLTPYTYTASNLPAGIVLNATTGAITGTPASPGLFTVVFRVNGAFGTTGTATRVIGVENTAMVVTLGTLPTSIDQGASINPASITITGGTPDLDGRYTRRLRACTLTCQTWSTGNASNLTLDDLDGIVGIVSTQTPRDYYVSVVATDSVGREVSSAQHKITVLPRLFIDSTNLPTSINERSWYPGNLTATYTPESGKTYAWSASGLPTGVTLNTTTAKLEGTATTPGTYNVTLNLAETTTATGTTRVAATSYAINVVNRPNVIAVSAGVDHSCAVYAETGGFTYPNQGRVLCWGHANNGQLGRKFDTGETSTGDLDPVEVTDANGTILTTMSDVYTTSSTVAGKQFSCANGNATATILGATESHYIWCWGYGGDGQLGSDEFGTHATILQSDSAVPVQLWRERTDDTWVRDSFSGSLAVGPTSVCSNNGPCTGATTVYTTPSGSETYRNWHPFDFYGFYGTSGPANFTGRPFSSAMGDGFGCYAAEGSGLSSRIICNGDNSMGQLGDGTTTSKTHPAFTTVTGTAGDIGQYSRVFAAGKYACYLSNAYNTSTPKCWGDNTGTQLGRRDAATSVPGDVKKENGTSLTNVTHVSLGVGGGCARNNTGEYWCWGKWGSTTAATLGLAIKVGQGSPQWDHWGPGSNTPVGTSSPIAVHQDHVIFIDATSIVRSWGDNDHKQLGRGNDPTPASDKSGTTDI